MAKIVFAQDDLRERHGIMHLSALLKKHGHQCDVFCQHAEKNIVDAIIAARPDILALSTIIVEHTFSLALAKSEVVTVPFALSWEDHTQRSIRKLSMSHALMLFV